MDSPDWRRVAQWRKAERVRLIAARLALSSAEREAHSIRIAADLDLLLSGLCARLIGVYWPFRGEPDLRAWMVAGCRRGLGFALPVVVARATPLTYRAWQPGGRLERGVWGIPQPVDGPEVVPDAVIAPLVGFDPAGYRLGYGGGFFDRTLAVLSPRPMAIGVGHAVGALATIEPQPHDIAMDWIVTGDGSPRRCSREGDPIP